MPFSCFAAEMRSTPPLLIVALVIGSRLWPAIISARETLKPASLFQTVGVVLTVAWLLTMLFVDVLWPSLSRETRAQIVEGLALRVTAAGVLLQQLGARLVEKAGILRGACADSEQETRHLDRCVCGHPGRSHWLPELRAYVHCTASDAGHPCNCRQFTREP